jgi:hypothetical protein
MKLYLGFMAVLSFFFAAAFAFADAPAPVPVSDFLAQVIQVIHDMGGLSGVGKVSAIVALIVGSMKVDQVKSLLWDKLPKGAQPWLAPILGLIAGILSLHPITFAGIFTYAFSGAGAIIVYELLDSVKVAAAANALVSSIIGMIQGLLKTGK